MSKILVWEYIYYETEHETPAQEVYAIKIMTSIILRLGENYNACRILHAPSTLSTVYWTVHSSLVENEYLF